jgi:hypothetical protein
MKGALALACVALLPLTSMAEEPFGLPLRGEGAESFLRTARVVERKNIGSGITGSDRYTLTDGVRTHRAAWKTIDEWKRGVTTLQRGGVIVDFADSWKHEVASYELDKLIGLELVPPTVERSLDGRAGSLQLWVERAMTEDERKKKKIRPPDVDAWNRQIHKMRLLRQLTDDTDYLNIRNVIFDPAFRVYAVDFSRAFSVYGDVRDQRVLERFPRPALDALRTLDKPLLEERLGRWLTGPRIDALLKRRDFIVRRAEQLAREKGESVVYFTP